MYFVFWFSSKNFHQLLALNKITPYFRASLGNLILYSFPIWKNIPVSPLWQNY